MEAELRGTLVEAERRLEADEVLEAELFLEDLPKSFSVSEKGIVVVWAWMVQLSGLAGVLGEKGCKAALE